MSLLYFSLLYSLCVCLCIIFPIFNHVCTYLWSCVRLTPWITSSLSLLFYCVLFCSKTKVSVYSSGWLGICSLAHAGFKLSILLPEPPMLRPHTCRPLRPAFSFSDLNFLISCSSHLSKETWFHLVEWYLAATILLLAIGLSLLCGLQ